MAVSSGTAAMHLSLLALGVGPGDEVITTPITWPATANVIVHTGATPVFADVREADLNIDPEQVAALVGPRTKAILPVHFAGQPADLDPISKLGLPVVEDAAHAVESAYRGRKIGALSEATCFSLYATKNVAAGEGGVITTNDAEIAQRDRRPSRDAARARLAVRHRRAGLQGEPLRRPGGDRALPAGQGRAAPRDPRAARRAPTTRRWRSWTGSSRWPATRATRMRCTSTSFASIRSGRARRATSTSRRMAAEQIGTSVHFLPVHTLSAYRERYPDQPPLPVAERAGRRGVVAAALACPLGRRHRRRDRRPAPRARAVHRERRVTQRRSVRVTATLVVTGLVSRLHRLEDRPPPDRRHPRRGGLLVAGGGGGDHDGDGAADGVALAAAAAGAVDRRAAAAG